MAAGSVREVAIAAPASDGSPVEDCLYHGDVLWQRPLKRYLAMLWEFRVTAQEDKCQIGNVCHDILLPGHVNMAVGEFWPGLRSRSRSRSRSESVVLLGVGVGVDKIYRLRPTPGKILFPTHKSLIPII